MKRVSLAVSAALIVMLVASQAQNAPLAVQHVDEAPRGNAVLPANTEALLKMSQDVTTKGMNAGESEQRLTPESD